MTRARHQRKFPPSLVAPWVFALLLGYTTNGLSAPCSPNWTCLTPRGDLDASGETDVGDVQCGTLMTLWHLSDEVGPPPDCMQGPIAVADVTCDGATTVGDLLVLIKWALSQEVHPSLDSDGDNCPDTCQQECPIAGTGCTCDNGGAAEGVDCAADGAAICAWYDAGYPTQINAADVSALLDQRDTFALKHDVTGGLNGDVCVVTSKDDASATSLRGCVEDYRDGPRWVLFDKEHLLTHYGDLTLPTQKAIKVPSDTTIDGRGVGGKIIVDGSSAPPDEHVLRVNPGASNVIITYLDLRNGTQDLIKVNDAARIWIHHNTFRNCDDECVNASNSGARKITVSWNLIKNSHYCALADEGATLIAFHHNHFQNCDKRSPRVAEGGWIHVYNNVIEDWGNASATHSGGYGAGAHSGGKAHIQANIFHAPSGNKIAVEAKFGSNPDGHTRINNTGTKANKYENGATKASGNNPDKVLQASTYYSYSADLADNALRAAIESSAGAKMIPDHGLANP